MSKNKSIGVFDSGLGGLTVVKELKKILPNEDIIYFGDTARIPYGTKSKETIYKYTKDNINFLLQKDVKAIVVACGTASSVVDENIIKNTPVPILTVVNPSVKTAINFTKKKNIGIIATTATIKSRSYVKAINAIDENINVYGKDCPLFVPLVENGYFHKENEIIKKIAKEYLSYFDDKNIDTLILGCTHYPLLANIISDIMGAGVKLVDAGKETAMSLKDSFFKNNFLNDKIEKGKIEYYVSDAPLSFVKEASVFLDEEIDKAIQIEI